MLQPAAQVPVVSEGVSGASPSKQLHLQSVFSTQFNSPPTPPLTCIVAVATCPFHNLFVYLVHVSHHKIFPFLFLLACTSHGQFEDPDGKIIFVLRASHVYRISSSSTSCSKLKTDLYPTKSHFGLLRSPAMVWTGSLRDPGSAGCPEYASSEERQ